MSHQPRKTATSLRFDLVLAASVIVWLLLAGFVVWLPYDKWWAGSMFSRPGGWLAAMIFLAVAPCLYALSSQGERIGRLAVRLPWRWIVPSSFILLCFLFNADGVLGDSVDPEEGMRIRGSSPGSSALFILGFKAGEAVSGNPWLGLRVIMALLGGVWSALLFIAFGRLFGRLRGNLLAAGTTFSVAGAQFAGYFEESGIVIFLLPLALLFLASPPQGTRRSVLYASLLGGGMAAIHGAALLLLPAFALAGSRHVFVRRRTLAASRFAALATTGIGVLLVYIMLSYALRAMDGEVSLIASQTSGGDRSMFVSLVRAQQYENHFSRYTLFSLHWLWERLHLLALAGPGVLLGLLAAFAWPRGLLRKPALAAAFIGCLLLFMAWNFDWGLLRDWNLAAPWLILASFCGLVAGRPIIRLARPSFFLATGCLYAATGFPFLLHNHFAGTKEGLPGQDRWAETTGRGRVLFTSGEDVFNFKWFRVSEVRMREPGKVEFRVGPWTFSHGLVDRLEWRDASGNVVAKVEAESLENVKPYRQPLPNDYFLDDQWQAEPHRNASGGFYAATYRSEKAPPLEWTAALPEGRYLLFIRAFATIDEDPPGEESVYTWRIERESGG